MNLLPIYRQLKIKTRATLIYHERYFKTSITFCLFILSAIFIWTIGPTLTWETYPFLAQPEKRFYAIFILFLLGLLKFLLIDLNAPLFSSLSPAFKKKHLQLETEFLQMTRLLKATTLPHSSKTLHTLPWYLLIGPPKAGKTSLLTNADIAYLLKPRKTHSHLTAWWATSHACIVDPGECHDASSSNKATALWPSFLRLIKKYRGAYGIEGLLITLPFAENVNDHTYSHHPDFYQSLFARILQIQSFFPYPLPCQLILTKCDVITGFLAFFNETSRDEITRAWGITLTGPIEKKAEECEKKFNHLIKRLNQQLLWRLHHEKNPALKQFIKAFPLHIEHIKEQVLYFIKQCADANIKLNFQGVYLNSAAPQTMQHIPTSMPHSINANTEMMQLFKEPTSSLNAYFLKQWLTHIVPTLSIQPTLNMRLYTYKRWLPYVLSTSILIFVLFFLANDFKTGSTQLQNIKMKITYYQTTIQQIPNPHERLQKTIMLFSTLQPEYIAHSQHFELRHPFSQQAKRQFFLLYQQALTTLLLPEIKNYLEYFLMTPVNHNIDGVYAALKIYLMLGDHLYLQPAFIENNFPALLSYSMRENDFSILQIILHRALTNRPAPLILNTTLINNARTYLIAMPSLKLSAAILKNKHSQNNTPFPILSSKLTPTFFITPSHFSYLPTMYTASAFTRVLADETALAAQEALNGNDVLGAISKPNIAADQIDMLADQLRTAYVVHYVEKWERVLKHIYVNKMQSLTEIDTAITYWLQQPSPFLYFLQLIHEQTYFEPILSYSTPLRQVGALLDNTHTSHLLLAILHTQLMLLHQDLQRILHSSHSNKMAFSYIVNRMNHHGESDNLTQLRLLATRFPQPIQTWIDHLADATWEQLMQEAKHYMDVSLITPLPLIAASHPISDKNIFLIPMMNKIKGEHS